MTTADQDDIVVGVDGSAGSAAALRWALAEAKASGRRVVAVRAWSVDRTADPGSAATRSPQDRGIRYRQQLAQFVPARTAEERGPVPEAGTVATYRPGAADGDCPDRTVAAVLRGRRGGRVSAARRGRR
ncbi:universal stress protein [Amycolatopsis sp. NPDC049253]|uniref:universal stress protein n=1 Tax=Amycolatopsis sp. NPDC049253 TaxID=3155274 RepID=UPI003418EBE1